MSRIEIPKYTLVEELLNAISLGVGALLGIAGLVLAIVFSKTPLAVVSSAIYGSTLIILYTISCLYHSFSPKIKAKKVFRVLDHCSVYLLIFGTYMPYLLLVVKGALGWTLWEILLAMTILGIVLNCVDIEKFKKFSMISYIAMGWVIILSFKTVYLNLGKIGTLYLVIGGLCYTIGAIFYKWGKKEKYMHSVFHFLVLAGSIFHFFSIFFYIL